MQLKELKGNVLYLAEDELARGYKWYSDSKNINPSVQIISMEDIPEYSNKGYLFPSLISPATVLMRNPFGDKEFFDINDSKKKIIEAKITAIGYVARWLGAKLIDASAEFEEESALEKIVDFVGHYKVVDLDENRKKMLEEKYKKEYVLYDELPNNNVTKESWQKAVDQAKAFNLWNEKDVRSLIDFRNPEYPDQLLGKREIIMNVSEEVNSGKELAASLTVAGDIFKLGLNTTETLRTKKTIKFTSKIEF